MTVQRPLEGLRVVEVGLALAGPFAGSLLAELGAHVIKIEKPGGGDPMRLMGPTVNDVTVWWSVAARGKHCADLDLKLEEDRETFRRVIAQADVLVENYRPGVLERLGLGWTALNALNPRLIQLSVSGFGQTGPQSHRPGFGKIAEAMSGIVALTGNAGETPTHIGFSLADTSAGLMGTLGIALALYQRDLNGGSGTRIDVALYEPLFRIAECQLALCERMGRPPMREGSNDPYGWGVSGMANALVALRCADGQWLMALRAGIPGLQRSASPPPGNAADVVDTDPVSDLAARVGGLAVAPALALLKTLGVEAVQVHDGATLAGTRYFVERGDVVRTHHPSLGDIVVPGEMPKRASAPPLPMFRPVKYDEDRAVLAWARKR
jgi:formyl-CoA transferase